MERCCNVPDVPFTTYVCDTLHRQIKCNKLLKTLQDYQRSKRGKYLTKMNVRHNLACFPEMRNLQYLLATSNFGTTRNPYHTDFDLSCLGSWQNPENFMMLVFNELKNDPFKKIFTPFLNKPFDQVPFTSYGTGLKWPTKGDMEETEDISDFMSKFYDDIAGDPENLHSKSVATQTVIKKDDEAITEQEVREAFPFLRSMYSDETLEVKPYDTKERTQRARSLFTVYYHTPFDTKNIKQNTMNTAFAENSFVWNLEKPKKPKRVYGALRKSNVAWRSPKKTNSNQRYS